MQAIALGSLALTALPFVAGCARSSPSGPDRSATPATGEAATGDEESQPTKEPQPPPTPRQRDRRGDEHLFAGRFEQALADFDAFLAAEPELGAQHWRRGIACYYAGRYADGAAQFVLHRSVNPNDVENAAWHFLCRARASGAEAARAGILPVGPDQRDPMAAVYELYAGRATPRDVLDAAAASTQRDAPFFAHLYLGLYFEVLGEPEKAREHMDLAAGAHGRDHYMGRVARMHAALLAE